MKDHLKELEEELKELNMTIVKDADVNDPYGFGIEFDIDTDVDYSHLIKEDFVMKKRTRREDFFYIALKSYDTEKKKLSVFVGTPISEKLFKFYGAASSTLQKPIGTHFSDLCWYHAEGTTKLNQEDVITKFREEAEYGDLSLFLPTRIIDNFIEIMHTLNQSFLEGLMEEAICYGPYLMKANNKK